MYANWQSHLLQMRGLKPIATYSTPGAVVASFTDAWIETITFRRRGISEIVASFTDAWIETLKFGCHLTYGLSHLLQMRGLKLKLVLWRRVSVSRIFYRCVDWNKRITNNFSTSSRRIFYRCVDWNLSIQKPVKRLWSRIFYRCVDWNKVLLMRRLLPRVASFTDAWIETSVPTRNDSRE